MAKYNIVPALMHILHSFYSWRAMSDHLEERDPHPRTANTATLLTALLLHILEGILSVAKVL